MASVSKREWGDGKSAWIVRYVDSTGSHRQKTFKKKKDADAFANGVEAEILARGSKEYIESKTVEAIAREYLNSQELRMNDGKIGFGRWRNMERALRLSIIPYIGKMKFDQLTDADILKWHDQIRSSGKLAPVTAARRLHEMRLLSRFAVARRYAKEDPTASVMNERGSIVMNKIRTFSREDVAALLKSVEKRGPYQHRRNWEMIRLAVHLAAFCGLRYGEIMGLTLSKVNFGHRVIEVRHSITDMDELKGPKTQAGLRDVPLPEHIATMLKAWIKCHYLPNDRQLLFRSKMRKHMGGGDVLMQSTNFHTSWRKLLDDAGLRRKGDELHFHALRHFAASYWIMQGLPLTDTASLLGHKKFDITLQIYAHPIVGGHRRTEAFDRMAQALLSNDDTPVNAGRLLTAM